MNRTIAGSVHDPAVLVVSSVSKAYPTPRGSLNVLADVSLTLTRGDRAAVTGPSGSGKSTLLYILGALEPPTSGDVTIEGQHPFRLAERELAAFRNRQIGFVFQDHLLLPQCTVLENVLVPALVHGVDEEARGRARELIEQVGLSRRIDHRPAELSGGERQRVALARALIRRPLLLLADEPTGNLDQASADVVADLLFSLHQQQQTMLVIVTHNVALAAKCPIRFRLAEGRVERT